MSLLLGISLYVTEATFGPGFMAVPFDGTASDIFGFACGRERQYAGRGSAADKWDGRRLRLAALAWIQQTKLVSSDGSILGTSVAIDGNTLVSSGHVFVNYNGTWSEQAKLPGGNVAISRDAIAVSSSSAIQVFLRNHGIWMPQAVIPVNVSSAIVTVALENDTLLVGAPNAATAAGFAAGIAFIYGRQNGLWTQQATLTASEAQAASLHRTGPLHQ